MHYALGTVKDNRRKYRAQRHTTKKLVSFMTILALSTMVETNEKIIIQHNKITLILYIPTPTLTLTRTRTRTLICTLTFTSKSTPTLALIIVFLTLLSNYLLLIDSLGVIALKVRKAAVLTLPGQNQSILQLRVSFVWPTHSRPPFFGGGLVQDRVRT